MVRDVSPAGVTAGVLSELQASAIVSADALKSLEAGVMRAYETRSFDVDSMRFTCRCIFTGLDFAVIHVTTDEQKLESAQEEGADVYARMRCRAKLSLLPIADMSPEQVRCLIASLKRAVECADRIDAHVSEVVSLFSTPASRARDAAIELLKPYLCGLKMFGQQLAAVRESLASRDIISWIEGLSAQQRAKQEFAHESCKYEMSMLQNSVGEWFIAVRAA